MTPADEPIIDAATLPAPRLQLRWEKTDWHADDCVYELVVPVHANDIRDQGGGVFIQELGRSHVDGCGKIPMDHQIDLPYRDGAHAAWDSHALGLPAYAVDGDRAARIPPRPHPDR